MPETQSNSPNYANKDAIPGRAYLFFIADEFDSVTSKVTRQHFTYSSAYVKKMLEHRPLEVKKILNPSIWASLPVVRK